MKTTPVKLNYIFGFIIGALIMALLAVWNFRYSSGYDAGEKAEKARKDFVIYPRK